MYEYYESHVLPEGKCRNIIKLLHGFNASISQCIYTERNNKQGIYILAPQGIRKRKKKGKRETIKPVVAPGGKKEKKKKTHLPPPRGDPAN